jgi:hypothetical protein
MRGGILGNPICDSAKYPRTIKWLVGGWDRVRAGKKWPKTRGSALSARQLHIPYRQIFARVNGSDRALSLPGIFLTHGPFIDKWQ